MSRIRKTRLRARQLVAGLAFLLMPCAEAQTTDGYHALQVFPVVVDTASFAQRFTFRNPNPASLTLRPRYFPANGTTSTQLTCPDVVVPANASATITSLRTLCPALPTGSQFGFLTVRAATDDTRVFAGFSRVANPQGNGFSVEAFAAHVFTSATSMVSGVVRAAATPGSPAFQTNCFVGNMAEIAPIGTTPVSQVHYTVQSALGLTLGSGDVNVAPGQVVRLLDVFAVAPAGDYSDARVRFEELGPEDPGILAFCTVQDNTSFGADFRVAKQEIAEPGVIGARDTFASRYTRLGYFIQSGSGILRLYAEHVFYFHHPDEVSCTLIDGWLGTPATAANNMEMRLLDADGLVVAGGNNVVAFSNVYLGEKTDRFGGANGVYRLQVEDAEGGNTSERRYDIQCVSGSGHTKGERVFRFVGNKF